MSESPALSVVMILLVGSPFPCLLANFIAGLRMMRTSTPVLVRHRVRRARPSNLSSHVTARASDSSDDESSGDESSDDEEEEAKESPSTTVTKQPAFTVVAGSPSASVEASQPQGTAGIQPPSKSNGTFTVVAGPSPTMPTLAEGAAKIENDSLPGTNQKDPFVDERPQEMPLVRLPDPKASTTGMTGIMPGKNQPDVAMDRPTASPTPGSNSTQSSMPTFSSTSMQPSPSSTFSLMAASLDPVTTFVTITKPGLGREEELATPMPTLPAAATPEADKVAPSLSSLLPVTIAGVSAVATASPSAAFNTASNPQQRTGLNPLARTLLVIFVVLGAFVLFATLCVIIIVKRNRRRDAPFDTLTVPIKASESIYDGKFMTMSEKAIIDSATSSDGPTPTDRNSASIFTDAISSFLAKSRRLTYKISP